MKPPRIPPQPEPIYTCSPELRAPERMARDRRNLIAMFWGGVVMAVLVFLSGCAGLPQRSYSLSYTDAQGRTISGGVTLGNTRLDK